MGNKGSKRIPTQLPTNPPPPKTELNIILLGASRTGKSLLFYEINKMINNDDSKNNYIMEKYKIDQQQALSSTLDVFRTSFYWKEEELLGHLTDFILKFIPNETIENNNWDEKSAATWPCMEIWKGILNNVYLRNILDKKYREGMIPDNFYKLLDKIQKGIAIHEENYYPYCYFSTRGIIESMGHFNNKKIKAYEVGGFRSERKKWLYCLEYQDVVFLMISLVEFDQNAYEDGVTNRLKESLLLCSEIAASRYTRGKKNILLFTKADLLATKLRNGARYTGEMEYNILPELENISIDCNMRNIVNSIVSRAIEQIGRENFDSYHLISTLSTEDVKNVLLSAISNERRNTVSKCLCFSNNFAKKMLQYCSNGKCTDIQINCLSV